MDLTDLYRDVIVDHNKSPRNFRKIDPADRHAEGFNPLCGDKLKLYLKMNGERIEDISFEGTGCAISVASASMMTEFLKGKTEAEAQALFAQVHGLLTDDFANVDTEQLGKIVALAGVRQFPLRVKCASLCWHALTAALNDKSHAVSTE